MSHIDFVDLKDHLVFCNVDSGLPILPTDMTVIVVYLFYPQI